MASFLSAKQRKKLLADIDGINAGSLTDADCVRKDKTPYLPASEKFGGGAYDVTEHKCYLKWSEGTSFFGCTITTVTTKT